MSKKPDTRSLVNPVSRLSEATQRALLTGEIYEFKDRAKLILSVRRGNFVEVVEAYLLADKDLRADARRRDMLKTWDKVEERGGIIQEQSTGRRSDNPKQAREMQAQAFEQIGRSGKASKSARNGALSKGAPPWTPTPEVKAVCVEEWYSKRNATIDAAVARIQKRLGKAAPSRTTLYKHFGSPYASNDES